MSYDEVGLTHAELEEFCPGVIECVQNGTVPAPPVGQNVKAWGLFFGQVSKVLDIEDVVYRSLDAVQGKPDLFEWMIKAFDCYVTADMFHHWAIYIMGCVYDAETILRYLKAVWPYLDECGCCCKLVTHSHEIDVVSVKRMVLATVLWAEWGEHGHPAVLDWVLRSILEDIDSWKPLDDDGFEDARYPYQADERRWVLEQAYSGLNTAQVEDFLPILEAIAPPDRGLIMKMVESVLDVAAESDEWTFLRLMRWFDDKYHFTPADVATDEWQDLWVHKIVRLSMTRRPEERWLEAEKLIAELETRRSHCAVLFKTIVNAKRWATRHTMLRPENMDMHIADMQTDFVAEMEAQGRGEVGVVQ